MGRYKARKLKYFNLDYIKAFIKEEYKNKRLQKDIFNLSSNSNQYFFEYEKSYSFSVSRIPGGAYNYLFAISYENINIAFMGFNGKNRKDFIEITGQGLTIFGVDLFYNLMKYFGLKFDKFKRFDICFDLEMDINYFYEKILDKKYFKKDENGEYTSSFQPIFSKKNGLETMYFGKRNIKENSYILNRIYNKILDSSKKGKLFLYENDYKNKDGFYSNITRFETEIREDLAKFYDYESLKDKNILFYRIVKSFYKYNPQYFKFLKDKDFFKQLEKFKKEKIIFKKMIKKGDVEELKPSSAYEKRALDIKKAQILQSKYGKDIINQEEYNHTLQMFGSYAKKLYKFGVKYEDFDEILKNFLNI